MVGSAYTARLERWKAAAKLLERRRRDELLWQGVLGGMLIVAVATALQVVWVVVVWSRTYDEISLLLELLLFTFGFGLLPTLFERLQRSRNRRRIAKAALLMLRRRTDTAGAPPADWERTMSQEEDALGVLFNDAESGFFARARSLAIVVALVLGIVGIGLFVLRVNDVMAHEALEAHRQQRRTLRTLGGDHRGQVVRAEHEARSDTGPAGNRFTCEVGDRRWPSASDVRKTFDDVVYGRFVSYRDLRRMERCLRRADGSGDALALATRQLAYVSALVELERLAVPITTNPVLLSEDHRFTSLEAQLDGDPLLAEADRRLLRARLHSLPLRVAQGTTERRPHCVRILWDGTDRLVAGPTAPDDDTPITSLEVYVWQAECLRKQPWLSSYEIANETVGQTLPAEAAHREGLYRSQAQFANAVQALRAEWNAPVGDDGDLWACTLLQENLTGRLGSTLLATAARAYNGRAMTLLRVPVSERLLDRRELDQADKAERSVRLDRAHRLVQEAVCMRQRAQHLPFEVAGTQENLGIIAYRRLLLEGDDVREGFRAVRCLAEQAVAENPLLPWSWTLIYLTEYRRTEGRWESYACETQDLPIRSHSSIEHRLALFDEGQFAFEELSELLPLAPRASPLNRTPFDTLDDALADIDGIRDDLRGRSVFSRISRLPEETLIPLRLPFNRATGELEDDTAD